jgi:hypothetical protein
MTMQEKPEEAGDEAGKKFYVNVEGTEYEWGAETITTAQIRTLGGLPADQPVVEELPDGTERTLPEDEVIHLQPGHRYGRAAKYKRG